MTIEVPGPTRKRTLAGMRRKKDKRDGWQTAVGKWEDSYRESTAHSNGKRGRAKPEDAGMQSALKKRRTDAIDVFVDTIWFLPAVWDDCFKPKKHNPKALQPIKLHGKAIMVVLEDATEELRTHLGKNGVGNLRIRSTPEIVREDIFATGSSVGGDHEVFEDLHKDMVKKAAPIIKSYEQKD